MTTKNKTLALLGSVGIIASSAASAALPASVDGFFTSLKDDAVALIDKGWPVLLAVVGGFILMKLAKKAANKAT